MPGRLQDHDHLRSSWEPVGWARLSQSFGVIWLRGAQPTPWLCQVIPQGQLGGWQAGYEWACWGLVLRLKNRKLALPGLCIYLRWLEKLLELLGGLKLPQATRK